MNILVVSDLESKSLWDYYEPEKGKDIDLILSCGDVDPEYLSFLVTVVNCPLYYVHGNHDEKYGDHPPEGCDCIEDQIAVYQGVRILGLGGSHRYNGGTYQYTQQQMNIRKKKLWRKLRKHGGFDILLAHSAAWGIDDAEDPAHHGFHAFTELLDAFAPKYFIHGHIHMDYSTGHMRRTQYQDTMVINGYEAYKFCYETGNAI